MRKVEFGSPWPTWRMPTPASLTGARRAIVSEIDPGRAVLADRLGATAVLNPACNNFGVMLADLTDGLGPAVIFICTGAPAPFRDAVSLARKGGQIFVLGVCVEPVEMDFMSVMLSDLCLEGTYTQYNLPGGPLAEETPVEVEPDQAGGQPGSV